VLATVEVASRLFRQEPGGAAREHLLNRLAGHHIWSASWLWAGMLRCVVSEAVAAAAAPGHADAGGQAGPLTDRTVAGQADAGGDPAVRALAGAFEATAPGKENAGGRGKRGAGDAAARAPVNMHQLVLRCLMELAAYAVAVGTDSETTIALLELLSRQHCRGVHRLRCMLARAVRVRDLDV
jgi:hypothetical protein